MSEQSWKEGENADYNDLRRSRGRRMIGSRCAVERFFRRPFALLVGLLSLLLLCACGLSPSSPTARDGQLDLSGWDFTVQGPVKLRGDYQFYWQQLFEPADFQAATPPRDDNLIHLPAAWNNQRLGGQPLGPHGFATLRLKLRMPATAEPLALLLSDISSSYLLWLNGEAVGGRGVVSADAAEARGDMRQNIIALPDDARQLELVLQIANFHRQQGGAPSAIRLGLQSDLKQQELMIQSFDLLIAGGLGLLGFFFLCRVTISRLILGRSDAAAGWFVAVCFLWALHTFGLRSHYIFNLLPINWDTYVLLSDLILFLAIPSLTLFYSSLYPQESLVRLNRLWPGLAIAFCLMVIFCDRTLTHGVEQIYYFIGLAQLCYCLWILGRALLRGRQGAVTILIGLAVLGFAAINDVIQALGYIDTFALVPFGIVAVVFSQAAVLALRSTHTLHQVEQLSSELEENNLTLQRHERLKDQFLANTSHELRTPLHGIIGLAQSLRDNKARSETEKGRDLKLIMASGQRLSRLVNDILDLSRLQNRDISLNPGSVDLHSAADTVLSLCAPLTQGKALALVNDVPADLPPVEADEDRLLQILYNLVGNGVKFSHSGTVRITARPESKNRLKIAVSDSGPGIPLAKQEEIFQPFHQLDGSAAGQGGTGLGLAISRHLVELHSSRLQLESSPGRGAVFFFCLDHSREVAPTEVVASLPELEAVASPATVLSVSPAPDGAKQILLVDDDPVNLQIAANHLSGAGLAVTAVGSGEEALAQLSDHNAFDLVLLDVMMPGLSGLEVCRRLRHSYSSAELPVIMVTARNRLSDRVRGLAKGANDYLSKPFSREELLARCQAQLQVRAAHLARLENARLQERLQEQEEALARHEASPESEPLQTEGDDRRQLLVTALNLALDVWVRETATTKVELAQSCGYWKVYIDKDGWRRAQTLDRYLDYETIPKRPRSRQVIRTLDYVLAHCRGDDDQVSELRSLLKQLTDQV